MGTHLNTERPLPYAALTTDPAQSDDQRRAAERADVTVPARLTWKDQRGTTRFASVVIRNVSEIGVYVESQSPISIPLYRLVQFQLERDCRDRQGIPASLREGRTLSAVYRVTPPAYSGGRHGLALRLMVDPRRLARIDGAAGHSHAAVEDTRATA